MVDDLRKFSATHIVKDTKTKRFAIRKACGTRKAKGVAG